MSEEKELANLLHKRRKGETTERNKDLRLVGSTLRGESTSLLLAFNLDLPTVNRKEALLLFFIRIRMGLAWSGLSQPRLKNLPLAPWL